MDIRQLAVGAATMTLLSLAGCYENIEPTGSTGGNQTQQPAASQGTTRNTSSGQSALGGAKRAAENVVSDAEQRSRELADSIGND